MTRLLLINLSRLEQLAIKLNAELIPGDEVVVAFLSGSPSRAFGAGQIRNHNFKFGSGQAIALHQRQQSAPRHLQGLLYSRLIQSTFHRLYFKKAK
jgi:hypothetical protein